MTVVIQAKGAERPLVGAIVQLVAALCLGGGGSSHRIAEIVIEMTAVLVLALTFARPLPVSARLSALPVVLLTLWAALVLFQLLPLPASVWRNLPGRELAAAIADQIGAGEASHPLSLDPPATRRAFAALFPAAAMLLLVMHMDLRQRAILARTAIGCAFASLLLGVVQLISAGNWGTLYPEGHVGFATGLFANRNHQASFLLVASALCCGFVGKRIAAAMPVLFATACLLAGALATTSRAGFLLAPFALLPLLQTRMHWKRGHAVLALVAAAGALGVLISTNPLARLIVERLRHGNFGRLMFWEDSWSALTRYWPAGSGFGTFPMVFRAAEPLGHIGTHYVNHAHNEPFEIAIEGGLPALALLAIFIGWWIARGLMLARISGPARHLAAAAWAGLLVLMLHSLVDYPARILPIEAMAAMMVGLLTPVARRATAPHPAHLKESAA